MSSSLHPLQRDHANSVNSTNQMAGEQPIKERQTQPAPGAFPGTPAPDSENQNAFGVNPIPASEGAGNPIQLAPGEKVPDSSTINSNTVESGVRDDPDMKSEATEAEGEQTMSVNPIPATSGLGNPVQLAPGEKMPDPSTLNDNTVESTVKDPEGGPSDADVQPVQPDPKTDPVASGLGPQTGSQIPESSMGMGSDAPSDINKEDTGPMMSGVAPTSTTNQLAGQQPLEERREPTVIDDNKEDPTISSVAPSSTTNQMAGSVPKEDRREAAIIGESKENAEPASQKSGGLWNKSLMGGAAAVGTTAAGGAYAANEMMKDKTNTDPKSSLPESAQKGIDENATGSNTAPPPSEDPALPQQTAVGESPHVPSGEPMRETASAVPDEVGHSQKEAQFPPEAAASTEAVKEKSAVEDELLQKVPESNATGEPAPTESAAAATTAPAATTSDNTTSASGAPQLGDPTAGVAALSMDDKATDSKPEVTSGVATTSAPAESKPLDSRDVSPMSKPATNQPAAAGGSTAEATPRPQKEGASSTPQKEKRQSFMDRAKGTPESTSAASASESKKDKRRSLFGRIKDKLKS